MKQCDVEDCVRRARTTNGAYCECHYYRLRRTGRLDLAPRPPRPVCALDGCEAPRYWLGFCAKHGTRQHRHGDPLTVIDYADRAFPTGSENASWTGEDATYRAVHQRVRNLKGKAARHLCVDCGGPAFHWSYDRLDENERVDAVERLAYSLDPQHYVPRCPLCHRRFDRGPSPREAIGEAAS